MIMIIQQVLFETKSLQPQITFPLPLCLCGRLHGIEENKEIRLDGRKKHHLCV